MLVITFNSSIDFEPILKHNPQLRKAANALIEERKRKKQQEKEFNLNLAKQLEKMEKDVIAVLEKYPDLKPLFPHDWYSPRLSMLYTLKDLTNAHTPKMRRLNNNCTWLTKSDDQIPS